MTWRYVPARRIIDGEEMWDVREFYTEMPNGSGKADGVMWTLDAACAGGETLDELRQDLMNMLDDLVDPKHFLDLDADEPGLSELP